MMVALVDRRQTYGARGAVAAGLAWDRPARRVTFVESPTHSGTGAGKMADNSRQARQGWVLDAHRRARVAALTMRADFPVGSPVLWLGSRGMRGEVTGHTAVMVKWTDDGGTEHYSYATSLVRTTQEGGSDHG